MLQIGPGLVPQQGVTSGPPPADVAPVNTVAPAISGTAEQGQTLTASAGTWTGSPAPAFAYLWRRGGTAIAGATGVTYVLLPADVGAAITVTVTATNAAGSAAATSAATAPVTAPGTGGPALAALPVAPAARWHPHVSAVTTSGGRVTAATDIMALADLAEGGAGIGPKALTDALGRKFWRFEGAEFLNVATTLVTDNRAIGIFMVGRHHRRTSGVFFGLGNTAAGTVAASPNALDTGAAGTAASHVRSFGRSATTAPMVTGAQMQVIGALSRTTANGGTRLHLNRASASASQNGVAASGVQGAEIGKLPGSTSAANYGTFDLYELVVFAQSLTNAQGDAIAAALADHWGIAETVNQLVLEGDSITAGTSDVTSGASAAMALAEPGLGIVPAGWRVVNVATSGSTVATLTTRRDNATGWAAMTLSGGRNVAAIEIGTNDMGTTGGFLMPAQHYANLVAYLNTASTGLLQRGWEVRQMANIAGNASVTDSRMVPFRALLRDPQFLVDTASNAGGAFAGKVSIISTDLIEDGAGTVFLTAADAADTAYYQADQTHPSALGARVRVTGGTTPQHGVAAGL